METWKENAVKLFLDGMSYNAISREIGKPRTTVTNHLQAYGYFKDVPVKVIEANKRTAEKLRRKNNFICQNCGNKFIPKASDRTTYCSRECYFEKIKAKPKEPKEKVLPVQNCVICGKEFPGKYGSKYCGDECRKEYARRWSRNHAKRNYAPPTYICKECGKEFSPEYGDKRRSYCSNACSAANYKKSEACREMRKREKRRRRARLRGAITVSYNDIEIFKRDKWICQLCGKKVNKRLVYPHLMSASIDHIIPLEKGGPDIPENVQLAHFICNSLKGNRAIMPNVSRSNQLMIVLR